MGETVMPTTFPPPIDSWVDIAKSTAKITNMHVHPVGQPAGTLTHVAQNDEFTLHFWIQNASNQELAYDNIQVRLVGEPDQVDFVDPPGAIDYQGNPRLYFNTGPLDAGRSYAASVKCKARKAMATTSFKFTAGIYGRLNPTGHYWAVFHPT